MVRTRVKNILYGGITIKHSTLVISINMNINDQSNNIKFKNAPLSSDDEKEIVNGLIQTCEV